MRRYSCKGAITVFLSLLSVLFLSLLCTTVESARIQGCRGKAAAALDMGLFSVFGEFEKELLEKYDVFFLDGARGGENYSVTALNDKLKEYMQYNVSPAKGLWGGGYDPFKLRLDGVEITGVQLATDENGAAFYQQAVSFMKENLGTEMGSVLVERLGDAKRLEEAGRLYEQREKSISSELSTLEEQQREAEKQKKEREQAEREQAAKEGIVLPPKETETPAVKPDRNPLNIIRKIKKKGLMGLILGDTGEISSRKLEGSYPSSRGNRKGNLPVKKSSSGLTADLLFQQYLFERFTLFTDTEKEGDLDYELEYILCGKKSDEANLKSVVNRLLLMREGMNFLYLTSNPAKKGEADALAALLVGAVPVPGLEAATAYALMLVWAYGESLLDLRALMAGGKIPVMKSDDTWKLSLSSIPDLLEILESTDGSGTAGLSYEGYLQILYLLGNKKKYAMRALDMVEANMKKLSATFAFRADHMISKMEAEARFTISPVFLRISGAFLKTGLMTQNYHLSGSFAY